MHRHFVVVTSGFLALSSLAFPQDLSSSVRPIDGTVKQGGILHVATGTWTRNLPTSIGLGPDIVYNNSGYTGFYSDFNLTAETESFEILDAGRVPSTSSGMVGVDRDFYTVNCIDMGYCVGDNSGLGPLTATISLYNAYEPCESPSDGVLAGTFLAGPLPGVTQANVGTTAVSCWIVQLDLSGMEMCLSGDGEGVYDGDLDFDSFGIGYEFDPGGVGGYVGNLTVGPLLAGDRNWTALAPGELMTPGTQGGGGGGTYYGPGETCLDPANPITLNSSGLDNQDFIRVEFGPNSPIGPGCRWFQGYNNTDQCNATGAAVFSNPHAATYSVLYADASPTCTPGPPDDPTFCDPNNPNSTGSSAQLTSTQIIPPSNAHSRLHLDVSNGPPGEFGYFLIGQGFNETTPLVTGNGLLCLNAPGGLIVRFNVSGGGSLINSIGQFDANGDMVNIVSTSSVPGAFGYDVPNDLPNPLGFINSGETWYFQCWYRDTPAGPGQSNLTNGLTHTF